ncbi:aminobenzoyl-glutamate transporter [Edwardsiella hoshinae]|uniref:Aminobenzoyl-glutamate transport protein n=2 Tax=Edwardsiella hoshinae TaxID=93378 RepID=A0A376DAQ9_9GAMM|nr:AbgT family transporter [Edwardsiella hoshinae]AOV96219.1 aminobenzoyl-glutamate transporter [Edwardsiella hoshinae]STC85643.1 Aminobenzoyl-glutamate transport protein [Edwardsiella hoshinae]
MASPQKTSAPREESHGGMARFLSAVERWGNRVPDPALLFIYLMILLLLLSAALSQVSFSFINPSSGEAVQVVNMMTLAHLVDFLSKMTSSFTAFPPLGIVLVALLGVGVADRAGFIDAAVKKLVRLTPLRLLTPMVVLVALISHVAADVGYVLVIPLAGVVFQRVGRHPLAGICAAFAGVSGGYSASFIPSGNDALLAGFSEAAARLLAPGYTVNVLCNFLFTSLSGLMVILLVWLVTDRFIEPRLRHQVVDMPVEAADGALDDFTPQENRAFRRALTVMLLMLAGLALLMYPDASPFRSPSGALSASSAPAIRAIVPLIFILFAIPGTVYGFASGRFTSGKDVIVAMTANMSSMGYYLVVVFFAAQFIALFDASNLATLLALAGASGLKALSIPGAGTLLGVVLLVFLVNLLLGSASAKWALLSPILVPMLMAVQLSPELAQAAYRIGDSTSNIITPLMGFFPLVVVYCRKYVSSAGIGSLAALMLPYSLLLAVCWSVLLLAMWGLGVPLGIQGGYHYHP